MKIIIMFAEGEDDKLSQACIALEGISSAFRDIMKYKPPKQDKVKP